MKNNVEVNLSPLPTMIGFWELMCEMLGNRFLIDQLRILFYYYNEKSELKTIVEKINWTSSCGISAPVATTFNDDCKIARSLFRISISEKICSCQNARECVYKEPRMISLYDNFHLVAASSSFANLKAEEAISVLWLIYFNLSKEKKFEAMPQKEFLVNVAQEANWVHRMIFPNNFFIPEFGEDLKIVKSRKSIVFMDN